MRKEEDVDAESHVRYFVNHMLTYIRILQRAFQKFKSGNLVSSSRLKVKTSYPGPKRDLKTNANGHVDTLDLIYNRI